MCIILGILDFFDGILLGLFIPNLSYIWFDSQSFIIENYCRFQTLWVVNLHVPSVNSHFFLFLFFMHITKQAFFFFPFSISIQYCVGPTHFHCRLKPDPSHDWKERKKLIALMILIKANRFDLVLFIYLFFIKKKNHVLSTWLPLTWAASSVTRCAVTPTWHEKRKWNGPRVKHRVIHKQNLKYLWAQVRSLVTSTHRRILSTVATLFILSSLRSLSFELELTCLLFRKPHKKLIKKTIFF